MSFNRILLTGGTGFVGSRLARYFVQTGHECHILSRPQSDRSELASILEHIQVHEVHEDFSNIESIVTSAQADLVIHLATSYTAEHKTSDIVPMLKANLHYPTLLLQALRGTSNQHIINFGTNAQTFETSDYRPQRFHAVTKQAFEDSLDFFVDANNWKAITLRLFDTYGPGDPRRKVLGLVKNAAEQGNTLEMSPGEQLINIVHIDDVVRAVLLAMEQFRAMDSGAHRIFEVNADANISLRALVEKFCDLAQFDTPVAWGAKPYRSRELMNPQSAFPRLPGWSPMTSLTDGLTDLLNTTDD